MLVPFISNAQFLQRYDYRWIGQQMNDDGTDATDLELLNPLTTPGGILQTFALEASEMLMAACAVGARYDEAGVRTYGGNLLLRICADLMVAPVLKRRNRALSDEKALSASYDEAQQYLELLRRGERIFADVPDVAEAGLPATAGMAPIPGLQPQLITQRASRYFGFPVGGVGPWWC